MRGQLLTERFEYEPLLGETFSFLLSHLGRGLKKQVVIFAEGPGESHVDSAAASQDGFHKTKQMEVEIMPLMTTLGCVDFMFYCTREHPNKEFREQCQLLMYAVSSDAAMFKEYIDKLLTNPNKNLITFYPAIDDESKVEGLEIVGTILDGRLYFG